MIEFIEKEDISPGDTFIIIYDSTGHFDVVNLGMIDIDLYNNIDEHFEKKQIGNIEGVYEFTIDAISTFDGQYDEYGRCECQPYVTIEKCTIKKIGSIDDRYETNTQKAEREQLIMKDRLQQLVNKVDKARIANEDGVLTFWHGWHNTICLGYKKGILHKPLRTYNDAVTKETVERVERDVDSYLRHGLFPEDSAHPETQKELP